MYICRGRRSLEECHYVLLLMLMRPAEVKHSKYVNHDIASEQHKYLVVQMLTLCIHMVKTLVGSSKDISISLLKI